MSDPTSPQNPYAPPTSGGDGWVPTDLHEAAPLPTSVPKVFGVLSIIFASIVLLFGLLGSCGGFVGQGMLSAGAGFGRSAGSPEVQDGLKHMATMYMAIGIQSLVLTLMSALLLAIGVGQVRYRAWAGRWSVYWAGVALVVLVGMVVLSFAVIGPAYQRMMETIAKSSPSGAMPSGFAGSMGTMFGGMSGVMTVLFYAPYPILLLIFFTRDHIRAAMSN
jgi:hypothetical protein